MKKIYVAISYENRKFFDKEIKALRYFFTKKNMALLVFVDVYNFGQNQEKEMMQMAFKELDNADFLIAELSIKSIGVGIEIGYAYANKLPIIYLKKKNATYSATASGCAKNSIVYTNTVDLLQQLEKIVF